jgi:hypothetical protein
MKFAKTLAIASIALTACAANAGQTYTFADTAQSAIPGSFEWGFNTTTAKKPATLAFTLVGFGTVDGLKPTYTDKFTLTVNGSVLGTGYFNLGGGGITGWTGAGTVVNSNANNVVGKNGGTATFADIAFKLKAGLNTVKFDYVPLYATQNFKDESWKIAGATVTAVPEPETYAMLLAGLGVMGTIARRRKQKAA